MAEPVVVSRNCMGSPFTIQAYPDEATQPPSRLSTVFELAYAEIRRIEDLLTDFRPSPFNEINDKAGIKPVQVTREIMDLIGYAQQISRDSGGAFDISHASLGFLWREAFKKGLPPADEEIARMKSLVDFRKIEIDTSRSEVYLPKKGMRIGLGSIGKSYGVDVAYTLLLALGIKNFFINGAGDLRVHVSPNAPRPWRIGIKNPFHPDHAPCGVIQVAKGAVTTSGDYERNMEYQGKRYHHIIDARTSQMRNDISSVTVLAPTAVIANAHATAVMALGIEDGVEFLSRRQSMEGLIITSSGKVIDCGIRRAELSSIRKDFAHASQKKCRIHSSIAFHP